MVATIHILDRKHVTPKPCLELGANKFRWKGPSSLFSSIRHRLEKTCEPFRADAVQESREDLGDEYIGCYYGYINYILE